MDNPLWKAKRRAEWLYIYLEQNKSRHSQIVRYGRLVDVMASAQFRNYLKSLGSAIEIIPSEKIGSEHKNFLADVVRDVYTSAEGLTKNNFGTQGFKQGLLRVIGVLDLAYRSTKLVDTIHAS
ncbi:MAG: hypothetical protein AABX11_05700 [Nanoarchaeota archaeon]